MGAPAGLSVFGRSLLSDTLVPLSAAVIVICRTLPGAGNAAKQRADG